MEIGEKSEHKLKASAALLKHQMTGNPEKDYLYRGSLYGPLDIVGSKLCERRTDPREYKPKANCICLGAPQTTARVVAWKA